MKWAYENQIPKVVVETDNIVAFQIFRHQDEEEDVIEAEELIEVLHQINMLLYQYNKPRGEGKQN